MQLLSYYNKLLTAVLLILLGFGVWGAPNVMAVGYDLARQPLTEVKISLGSPTNELKYYPNHLEFVAGKRYKLILDNPSPQKHYFTAKDFADASWTQKVEAGKVEIKGSIHELELKPGAIAEWVFVPAKAGTYSLHCPIPGHTEAGMTGTITITTADSAA